MISTTITHGNGWMRGEECGKEVGTLQAGVHDIFQTITGKFLLGNLKLCAVQCSAVQCSAVQCSAVQYGGAVVV